MLVSVVLIILICVGINYLISYYRKRLPFIRAANALPGPKAYPIIGNAYYFLERPFDEFLQSVMLLTNTYSSPSRFWLGNKLLVFVTEPDQIQTILRSPSCINKNVMYDPFLPWLGTGLFTAPATIWHGHRKMLASSFNTNVLRVFSETFVEQALVFIDKLEHMVEGEVDLFHHFSTCTLDIIYATSLGMKLGSQTDKNNPYVKALDRLKEIVLHRTRNIFLSSDFIFKLTSLYREQQKHLDFIYSSAEKVLQQKEHTKNNPDTTKDEYAKPSRRTFLDTLIEASDEASGKKFTRKDIHDEINTMTFAATDTTAVTLNFIIFMLANFPEIQKKVYEELLDIYGTHDAKSVPVKFEDLQHMTYLERVIKETMRLFPVGAIIGRHSHEDLKIGEHIVPKGSEFTIVILATHRNEKYWPNAMTFDPDRFLPENVKNIHPYCYIPFSNGPRNCIGMRYAMMSMKILLSTILRTYIFKVDKKVKIDEIELKMDVTLAPIHPLMVRIEKRI